MPPELNTARLMAGAGPAPMLQAAAGWEAFAIVLETQADELAASLAALTSAWSGTASERAVAATMPMVVWLRTTALQAQKRAMQAMAQANSYSAGDGDDTADSGDRGRTTSPTPSWRRTNFFGVNRCRSGSTSSTTSCGCGIRRPSRWTSMPGGDGAEHLVRADHADEADRHPRGGESLRRARRSDRPRQ